MMVKVFMMRMVDETDGSVLHDVADFNDDFRIAWALEPHYDFFSRPSSSCRRSWWIWKRRLAGCKSRVRCCLPHRREQTKEYVRRSEELRVGKEVVSTFRDMGQ